MVNPSTITNLPASSSPLSGGEFVPIVQNGVTVRTLVSNITLAGQLNTVSAGTNIAVSQIGGVATIALSVSGSSGNIATLTGSNGLHDSGVALSSLASLVSPVFTTPNIGVATGTSLNLIGLTASELVVTDGSKNLMSTTALPNGTTATTQSIGDCSTKVATTAFVNVGNTLNASGYQSFGGGLVVIWGTTGTVSNLGSLAVSFLVTFPNACFGVIMTPNSLTSGAQAADYVSNVTTSGFTANNQGGNSRTYFFIAIGH